MTAPAPPSLIDCHTHVGVELIRYLRDEYPYCQDPRTLFVAASASEWFSLHSLALAATSRKVFRRPRRNSLQ